MKTRNKKCFLLNNQGGKICVIQMMELICPCNLLRLSMEKVKLKS